MTQNKATLSRGLTLSGQSAPPGQSALSALSEPQRLAVFGEFNHREGSGGCIEMDANWVRRNIVPCRLPNANGKGQDVKAQCHHLAKEPLERAFTEIASRGLWKLIRTFDGLWMPRHTAWHPQRPLSAHSWGIAFDLNAVLNPYGGPASFQNRRLNEIFKRYGFAWGGDDPRLPNAMHWELADVQAAYWQRTCIRIGATDANSRTRLILAVKREANFSYTPFSYATFSYQDFTYHAVPDALFKDEKCYVNLATLAEILGYQTVTERQVESQQVGLSEAVNLAGAKIVQTSDLRKDSKAPRYYVFVEPA